MPDSQIKWQCVTGRALSISPYELVGLTALTFLQLDGNQLTSGWAWWISLDTS
jgi:hypothetical protein